MLNGDVFVTLLKQYRGISMPKHAKLVT